jgi:hypothetical protein
MAAVPFTLDSAESTNKPSQYRMVSMAAAGLIAHAAFVAYGMKEQLQAHHHSDEHAAVQASRLPIYVVVELLIGLALVVAGLFYPTRFQSALRKDTTKHFRYDHHVNSGSDFVTFNTRGNRAWDGVKARSDLAGSGATRRVE